MVYLFSTCDNDMFRYVYGALEEPLTIVTLPESINNNKIARKIAHLLWRFGIFIKWNLFGDEFNKFLDCISPDDKVIFYARFPEPILNIVPRLNKKVKVSVWLWDTFSSIQLFEHFLPLLKKLPIKIASFDPKNARDGGIAFIPQVYNFCKGKNIEEEKSIINKCDCYFLGFPKDQYRKECLERVTSIFKRQGISFESKIVDGNTYNGYISYLLNLDNLSCCKAILELNIDGQEGLTLRTMEALSFKKKLITNNTHIKDYPFYKKENIFILGEDDEADLVPFINSEYVEITQSLIMQYDVNNWIKKIFL